mgnify:CR=1 FL=1
MRILTAAQIRAVEERAVDTGLDYLRLMENAGSACARFVAEKAQITLEIQYSCHRCMWKKAKTAATAS